MRRGHTAIFFRKRSEPFDIDATYNELRSSGARDPFPESYQFIYPAHGPKVGASLYVRARNGQSMVVRYVSYNRPRALAWLIQAYRPERALGIFEVFDLNQTVSALCRFFRREVPRLAHTYNWKIPPIEGFTQAGRSGYQPNLDLKAHLSELWKAAPQDDRLRIAKIIVSDWGKVRGNRPETLQNYINALSESTPPTPLQGVASYSKIFAIADPEQFAIYDARVAACLNAVQINAGIGPGTAFNYVPGRNKVVGNVATKLGFTQEPRFSPERLVKSGWLPVERNHTYTKYLEVLSLCLADLPDLPNYGRVSLEMALFANAECECQRAMTGRAGLSGAMAQGRWSL